MAHRQATGGRSRRAGRAHWWSLLIGLAGCSVSAADSVESTAGTPGADSRNRGAVIAAAAADLRRGPVARSLSIPRRAGFEVNQGQWPSPVTHVARDGEATLFLTSTEAVWRFVHGLSADEQQKRNDAPSGGRHVRMRWLGANPAPTIVGSVPQAVQVNYFRGSDRAGWRQGVPLYGRVTYRDLYPGIDLVFHDERGALEYDFVVAPGADPGVIRLAFDRPAQAMQASDGDLELVTDAGAITHHRPIAYQELGANRSDVPVSFQIDRAGTQTQVAFAVGAYDRGQPLVVDPSVAYRSIVDPMIFTDNVVDAALNSDGSLWLVGMTLNAEFPVTDDAIDKDKSDLDDGYVVKLNPQGELVYATYLGGNSLNCMAGVAVDSDGNVFAAGTTISTDFPVTAGALQPTPPGGGDDGGDGFLVKLDRTGQLLYSTYFGGSGYELCTGRGQRWAGVATAPDDSIYLLISTTGSQELPGPGGARTSIDGDLFLARFSPELQVEWGRFLGSPGANDQTTRVRTDAQGNAYVLGVTNHLLGEQHDFPTTPGAFQTDSPADQVHFVAKFATNGDLAYATLLGPTSGNSSSGFTGELAVDVAGNAYVAMVGADDMPVTPGAFQSTHKGFGDVFVAKLDPTGSSLLYGTYLGGASNEQPNLNTMVLAINEEGNAYVGSSTFSSDIPLRDAFDTTPRGNFVAKLTPDGTDLVYSSYLRHGTHVIVAGNDALYVAGRNDPDAGIGVVKIDDGGAAPACPGDCDQSGVVAINELIIGVRIILGEALISTCISLDTNNNGTLEIAELIGGVLSSLQGCA